MAKTFEAMQRAQEKLSIKDSLPSYVTDWTPLTFKQRHSLSDILGKIGMLENSVGSKIYHFASANSGEGTSTILINLAQFLADIGFQKKVLIVDGNLERPVMQAAFHLPQTPGLCEVLRNEAVLSQSTHQIDQSNIYILTCGQPDKDRFSIDVDTITALTDKIRQEFQFVIFDSSPILTSSFARLWSGIADASFLIIQANRTQWEVARKAQTLLEKQGRGIAGVILNRVRYAIPNILYRRV